MNRILLVEDDPLLVQKLKPHLISIDCHIEVTNDWQNVFYLVQNSKFDLLIVNIKAGQLNRIEICKQLKESNNGIPIMMLSNLSEEIDKVIAYEMGVDHYIIKPFSIPVVIARIKSILRRTNLYEQNNRFNNKTLLNFKNLSIDIDKKKVTLNEKRLKLSRKEFDILSLLAKDAGKSFPRYRILNLIWGCQFSVCRSNVDSHINRLRSKIEPDSSNPIYILTSWGIGYRFNDNL